MLLALLIASIVPMSAFAATAGPEYGTGSDGGGSLAWTGATNISANNNNEATRSLNQNQTSNTLWAKNMGFAIPEDATIQGISVTIGRFTSGSSSPLIRDNTVSLTKDGSAFVGDNNAVTGTNWPTSEGTRTYGSASSLWGTTWTPAEINATTFGVGLRASNTNSSSRTASVDYMNITVTYSVPGGPSFAQTAVNDSSAGNTAWSNAGDVDADDGQYATANVATGSTSQYLNASGLGFNLPSDANINGVTVVVDRLTSGMTTPLTRDHTVQLLKDGTRAGDNKAVTDADWPTGGGGTRTYGGAADSWGETWTPADVNDPDFGVSLRVANANTGFARTASVDYIQVTVSYDRNPTVTVNEAAAQADPTGTPSIDFDVVFNKDVTGVGAGDFTVGGTATGFSVDSVSGSGSNYTVTVVGAAATDGTVTLAMPAGGAEDSGARTNKASTSTDNSVTYDTTAPTVTVEQGASQADPTNVAAIDFDVTFDEAVTGLSAEDFAVGGSATGFAVDSISGSGASYSVTVTGTVGSTEGTVTLDLGADTVVDGVGLANAASTSTDNEVTYDITAPVTLATVDPATADGVDDWYVTAPSITFSTEPAATTWYKWDDAASYTSYALFPTVIAPDGEHTLYYYSVDAAGNIETAGSVDLKTDTVAPTVTLEQGASQPDPSNVASFTFDVVFSEPVTGLISTDFTLGGSATGFDTIDVTGGGDTYVVTVSGAAATEGTVTVSVNADAAVDVAGNTSEASTSSDNEVTYDITAPAVTVEQASGQDDPTNVASIDFDVAFDEDVTGLSAEDFTVGGTATGFAVDSVSGSGATYSVSVTGTAGATDGTVTLDLPADGAADMAGNLSEASTSVDNSVVYDATAPVTTMDADIDPNVAGWYNAAPFITLTADDPGADVSYKWDAGSYALYGPDPLEAPEGTHTLYYYAEDAANNIEAENDAELKVDTVDPTGAVSINDGDAQTTSVEVTLTVSAADASSGVEEMRFSANGTDWSAWEDYDTEVAWTLGSRDGTQTVYAQFRDAADNVSATASDEIVLDASIPSVTVEQAAAQDDPTNVASVIFDVVFTEDVLGLTTDDFTVGGTAAGFDTVEFDGSDGTYEVTVSGTTVTDGTVTLALDADKVVDASTNGNSASTSSDNSVTYDATAPTVTVEQGGAQVDPTNVASIDFDVTFSEDAAGVTGDDFAVGGTAAGFTSVVVAGSDADYTVTVSGASPTDGTVTLALDADEVTDLAGNGNEAATSSDAEVTYDGTAPAVAGLAVSTYTPSSVSVEWDVATDPAGIDGYVVSRSGSSAETTVTGTSYTFEGLAANTDYTFTVKTIDGLGNVSAASSVSRKTPATSSSVAVGTGSPTVNLVTPDGTVTVVFANVTTAGTFYLTPEPNPPAGATGGTYLRIGDMSYELTFTGAFTGDITITLPYKPALPDSRALDVKIRHLAAGGWETITPTVNVTNHTFTFKLTSLSPLVVVEPSNANKALGLTTNFNGQKVTTRTYSPVYGSTVTLFGTLKDADGKGVASKKVMVQRYTNGVWANVAQASSTTKGVYTFKTTAGSKTLYRFMVTGDAFTSAVYGSSYTLYPKVKVSVTAAPKKISRNKSFTIKGKLTPKHAAGTKVTLKFYKLSKGKYRYQYSTTVKVKSSGSSSVFSKKLRIKKAGTWRVRIYSKADTAHAATYSAYSKIKVR